MHQILHLEFISVGWSYFRVSVAVILGECLILVPVGLQEVGHLEGNTLFLCCLLKYQLHVSGWYVELDGE